MRYPDFFDSIQNIKLQDPLSDILGVFEDGFYEISYIEVVKGAGHSCPTVAGAYIMAQEAIKALYSNGTGIRGDIKVEFKEDLSEGVAGVIANVVSYITGATDKSGFKGLNGKFARHSLMFFNQDIKSNARFTSLSQNKTVDVYYNPNVIPPSKEMQPLMQKIMQNQATDDEKNLFGKLWQERVKNIFENIDKAVSVEVVK